ncbi:MAG: Fe-S cluster assembly protein SufB [Desulfurococcales archaeon]|nr:Fe-S cluster assembly protein SufB [Desulfurococcales archaeon]
MNINLKHEIPLTLGEARPVKYEVRLKGELTEELVRELSELKGEPEWMLNLRLRALEWFHKLPMPKWVRGVEELDLSRLVLYSKPKGSLATEWGDVPPEIRRYYEALGIPEQEAKLLSGINATFGSESIYSKLRDSLRSKGVIMMPTEEAVRKYPELVRKYFGRVFPYTDHKFAALHTAFWSGGAFVYVPPNVRIDQPLEALFLIGSPLEGQFEHTLIIAGENSYLNFIEACAAPRYSGESFHDGMVEIYAHRGATVKFTTIQNWSKNVINFGNKRAILEEGARVDWMIGSLGSKVSYEYPMSVMKGAGSSSQAIMVSIAKGPYIKDGGAKMIHAAPNTKSRIVSKSISGDGGLTIYRGLIKVLRRAANSFAHAECDSLILDNSSQSFTYPHNQVDEPTSTVIHEATAGRLGEEQLFYLLSRGLSEAEAKSLAVMGFLDDLLIQLPFEYANILRSVIEVEFSRLGGVG